MIAGTSVWAMPYVKQLYEGFLFIRNLIVVGFILVDFLIMIFSVLLAF